METSKKYGIFAIVVIVLILAGCTDSIDKAIDKYNNGDSNSDTTVRTSGVVRYNDGTPMGTTRTEPQVNGGFPIYHMGTGTVIGFIQLDGQVNDIGGRNLGVCTGSTISDSGLSGDCTVPFANPNQIVSTQTQTPESQSATSGCSNTSSTTPAGCEDRRDGLFDVTWDRPTCEQHGYFYCTLNNICTNQTVNINECLAR